LRRQNAAFLRALDGDGAACAKDETADDELHGQEQDEACQ